MRIPDLNKININEAFQYNYESIWHITYTFTAIRFFEIMN
jgi:hypothetical protein